MKARSPSIAQPGKVCETAAPSERSAVTMEIVPPDDAQRAEAEDRLSSLIADLWTRGLLVANDDDEP